ncbi:MAG: flippase-like domain-containing protein [SAR202 cluster bacterium]|nr:hypothetical protein [Chloroflexota bacterium]MQG23106.1 flippase-like domain-containing protein [SAR202 cluster bacterium]|tara:strand:+ start:11172 stop:12155 length:984 start_codon:yes stop_codon:yes gene_type:complete
MIEIKNRVFSFPTLLSFVGAVAIIYFLAEGFELDWKLTLENVSNMNIFFYILALIVYYISFIFRGYRWKILATNALLGDNEKSSDQDENIIPSALSCSLLILSGWFLNAIAWLRMGDAYRAWAFGNDTGKGFSWGIGTLLAERTLDMMVVAVCLVFAIVGISLNHYNETFMYILFAAILMGFFLVAAMLLVFFYGGQLANKLPSRLKEGFINFKRGTSGGYHRIVTLTVLGLLGWIMEMIRFWLIIQALNLELSIPMVVAVSLGNAILSTVPTPGGLGIVEPGITGMLMFEMSATNAASVALSDRSITYLSVIFLGGITFALRRFVR